MTNYKKYVNEIKFAIEPEEKGIILLTGQGATSLADLKMTTLPKLDHIMKKRFYELCLTTPRMSTFAIGSLINKIVFEMSNDLIFLNIGV